MVRSCCVHRSNRRNRTDWMREDCDRTEGFQIGRGPAAKNPRRQVKLTHTAHEVVPHAGTALPNDGH